MELNQLSLARQMDMVVRELSDELSSLSSGTVFVQIRNNAIGKFGIRHNPIESRNGEMQQPQQGLTSVQQRSFRNMAIEALKYKTSWTHGEICFDFTVRQQAVVISVQFESHYNMANLLIRMNQRHTYREKNLDL
ncbi:hypothetical protein PAE9249_00791 [Paenibacillus sp. CECT 9249]|nr:hypothetical protein PAE9249_00791 [Paenibacillus sp. CECT 9249]